ncbi:MULTISPECIES: hypothetical protein [unclassified Microbacterium]|uniref:hypothetical protein n=1 Tax=unclassified Microbacterium TaxID=2609290 RepID=UPI003412D20F
MTALGVLMGTSTLACADDEISETLEEIIAGAPEATEAIENPEPSGSSSVSIASETDGTIRFSQDDGSSMSLVLPDNAEFADDLAEELGETTMITSQYMTTDRGAPDSQAAASARAVLVIPNADAPSSYDFEVQVPDGTVAEHHVDGSITLHRPVAILQDGVQASAVIATFDAPWAVDANGVNIPTSYSFDGRTLTQTIDLSAVTAFPVVADPKVDWMGYFVRLTYSKAETRNMRDQGIIVGAIVGAGATISLAAGPAAPAIIAAVYAASAVAVGVIATTASNAVSDGKCLQLDIPSMFPSIVKCRK